jgi:hypothetical protein
MDPLQRPAVPRNITNLKMEGGSISKKRLTFNREAFQALAFLQEVVCEIYKFLIKY